MRFLPLALVLVGGVASAQTLPLRLPQFIEPPASNGADAVLYPNGVLYNPTLGCIAGALAGAWPCLATDADVTAAQAAAVSQAGTNAAATYMPTATANAANATQDAAAATLAGRVTTLESQVATVQGAATAAQATATAAQTATSTNAAAISSLATRVTTAEAAITALQALPKRACTTATLTGLSIPLTGGLSSTQNVNLVGVPVGTTCTVAGSTRAPAGATGSPVVTTAGVVSVAFVGGGGLLSGVIAIPNGTYRICCDI